MWKNITVDIPNYLADYKARPVDSRKHPYRVLRDTAELLKKQTNNKIDTLVRVSNAGPGIIQYVFQAGYLNFEHALFGIRHTHKYPVTIACMDTKGIISFEKSSKICASPEELEAELTSIFRSDFISSAIYGLMDLVKYGKVV